MLEREEYGKIFGIMLSGFVDGSVQLPGVKGNTSPCWILAVSIPPYQLQVPKIPYYASSRNVNRRHCTWKKVKLSNTHRCLFTSGACNDLVQQTSVHHNLATCFREHTHQDTEEANQIEKATRCTVPMIPSTSRSNAKVYFKKNKSKTIWKIKGLWVQPRWSENHRLDAFSGVSYTGYTEGILARVVDHHKRPLRKVIQTRHLNTSNENRTTLKQFKINKFKKIDENTKIT